MLTDKQRDALFSIRNGAGPMPIVHFGALLKKGYVERVVQTDEMPSPGYKMAKITDAGFLALEG